MHLYSIYWLAGSRRAKRPCTTRTRLFNLINMQKTALCVPRAWAKKSGFADPSGDIIDIERKPREKSEFRKKSVKVVLLNNGRSYKDA